MKNKYRISKTKSLLNKNSSTNDIVKLSVDKFKSKLL